MDNNYIELVEQEVSNLKKHALQSELNKLNVRTFNSQTIGDCIYGQLTGSCFSQRAFELIQLCTTKLCQYKSSTKIVLVEKADARDYWRTSFTGPGFALFTPLEVFIGDLRNDANGNNIIILHYLQGLRKTLILKPLA